MQLGLICNPLTKTSTMIWTPAKIQPYLETKIDDGDENIENIS
jgi:hypothetical protein